MFFIIIFKKSDLVLWKFNVIWSFLMFQYLNNSPVFQKISSCCFLAASVCDLCCCVSPRFIILSAVHTSTSTFEKRPTTQSLIGLHPDKELCELWKESHQLMWSRNPRCVTRECLSLTWTVSVEFLSLLCLFLFHLLSICLSILSNTIRLNKLELDYWRSLYRAADDSLQRVIGIALSLRHHAGFLSSLNSLVATGHHETVIEKYIFTQSLAHEFWLMNTLWLLLADKSDSEVEAGLKADWLHFESPL